ncbi:hypothetical protein [Streptomyces naphthomycinicus]|uniref:hypothetical protein n=1 Tax=Streptomyces naphthomycinicus TaxID=2872625 RepID=UPI0021F147A3|nr:hypothetical protein [Streptomyces sp. TML10]
MSGFKPSHRSLALLAVAVAVAAGTAFASTAPASEPDEPARATAPSGPVTSSLKGWGRMDYPDPGHDIQVTVDAHAVFKGVGWSKPDTSWGTFRVYHRMPGADGRPETVNWGDFEVDCLTTGGPTATVTGRIVGTGGDAGGWDDYLKRHVRMGVSFYVGAGKGSGPSRIGLSGGTEAGEPLLSTCMAPAADAKVIKGGYHLTDRTPAR